MTYLRRNYHAPGTAPGTYDIERTRASETCRIVVVDYTAREMNVTSDPPGLDLPAPRGVRWLRVSGKPSLDVLEGLRTHLGVDPLVLEDIVTSGQRPKFSEIGSGLFFTFAVPVPNGAGFRQLSLYLTGDTLMTHIEAEEDLFDPLLARLDRDDSRIRREGPYFLLYALLDLSIDHLFPVLDDVGNRLETLEEEILGDPSRELLGKVHGIRNELLFLRKVAWATREVISDLLRHMEGEEEQSVRAYVNDAYDHIVSAIDLVETFRDMATSLIEVHMSVVSNRINEVMRVLTIIATVFIPPTFVTGVYGMNFDRGAGPLSMPELGWPLGYVLVMGVIGLMMIAMLVLFRRKGWL